jgi:hypothetical protein
MRLATSAPSCEQLVSDLRGVHEVGCIPVNGVDRCVCVCSAERVETAMTAIVDVLFGHVHRRRHVRQMTPHNLLGVHLRASQGAHVHTFVLTIAVLMSGSW